eukprot:gene10445-7537_t
MPPSTPFPTVHSSLTGQGDSYHNIERHISTMYGVLSQYKDLE